MDVPAYFETSWSILSTIGIFLTFASISVIAITHACILNFVPLVVSASCAIANGMCWFAYYTNGSITPRLACLYLRGNILAGPGISFYSYLIISRILHGRQLMIFLVIFWALILDILGLRITITVYRAMQLARGNLSEQHRISHLHTGYFVSLALLETWSSFFLIKQLARAYLRSPYVSSSRETFLYLTRSAELRLASLFCIGIARAVTYSSRVQLLLHPKLIDLYTRLSVSFHLDILASKRERPQKSRLDPYDIYPEDTFSSPHHSQWIGSFQSKSGTRPGSGQGDKDGNLQEFV
ncbi:hypothetical protein P175DRAFT_0534939 [Aspergillus ochraceoroseus IBT 24754]|uniref:Uncharacterized protein n=1 Tax=Aspergillus ochraceoroseus IBT 24754 TaxID=1392256 RepID=A0A2T5LP35_9EURO|nr:uncharacterized protein P175DRAFT_0534939 [Aspergillus ochraceoroseus IBT 24754]PTU18035.1 hypothetical protein P175DRAFT_0534939 [Aspergillus ochraceoroseus IBT 24754]